MLQGRKEGTLKGSKEGRNIERNKETLKGIKKH
jgi:hypothetical protein